jgi:predicted Zn-dependent peptidase
VRGLAVRIPEHGGEAAIEALTSADVAGALLGFLRHGRPLCIAMGVLPQDLPSALAPLLGRWPGNGKAPALAAVVPSPRPARTTREHAAMQQAKLVLVFRVPPPSSVPALCALQVLLSLWGGGAHSRLFREVRERRSLCYYAGASGDAHKGIVLVQVGCDPGAIPAVVAEVQAQLAELAAGRFDDGELRTAVATICGPLLGIDDAMPLWIHYTAEQWWRGIDQEPAARLSSYRQVEREAVVAAARSLWLDHEYALLPEERPA